MQRETQTPIPMACLSATVLAPVLTLAPGRLDLAGRARARSALEHARRCPRCRRALNRELGVSWQCPLAGELLLPYRDGAIGDDDRSWLERHLAACAACSAELALLAEQPPVTAAGRRTPLLLRLRQVETLAAAGAALDLVADTPAVARARLHLASEPGEPGELACTIACGPRSDADVALARIRLPRPLPAAPWLAWAGAAGESLEIPLPPAGIITLRLARVLRSPTPDERRALWELLGRAGLEVQVVPAP